ncbi:hypothetical protein HDU76_011614 [Blyttiomyces sp. JEL0837]|nr:hypothetical protein HDU76_011614 [Blyttiomyces sp. JEL0837]
MVTCSNDGHVIEIAIEREIPESFGSPNIIQFYKRHPLIARANAPANLANLQILDLSSNKINGSIPISLSNIKALTTLALGSNQIAGGIPAELGTNKFAKTVSYNILGFDLSANNITGEFPSAIGSLKSLVSLVLSTNQFSGPLPPALKSLNFTTLKLDNNCVPGKLPLGGNNVVFNGRATAVAATTTTAMRPAAYTPKTVDCFPKSMSKYITKPSSPSTPNIYGINGDARNATCDPALQARNTHCLGICVVQCVGEPYNAWKYMACSGGRVCKKIGRLNVCVLPTNPATTTLPYIKQTSTPTLPQVTSEYVAPAPTTTQPVYQPTVTAYTSDKCFDYSINGPFVPSTGPNLYGPNGDAEGATCYTEGQINNLHCAGSCAHKTNGPT